MMLRHLTAVILLMLPGCIGTTGGDIIDFPAAAAGPADANENSVLEFTTYRGWHVVLTKAQIHIGAVYLDQSLPVSGAQNTSCILPGTYVAQVTGGMDVDMLSPTPKPFPTPGHGTTLRALVGQIWLVGGDDINQVSDPTPILTVEGTAEMQGDVRPFSGNVTISDNRLQPSGQLAGANPICKQRIVSPIPASITIARTGGLLLRVDPRLLFVNVDFSELNKYATGFGFSDDPKQIDLESPLFYSQPSANLYQNLHAAGGLYAFTWDSNL